MAFYSQGKEFLNLPEQVQKNIDDISNLTVAVATKQELANAVNDTNLKEKVEAVGSYDLGAVSVTSLTNTGNTTNTGTLDQEGKATFGSDVEVDGSATFNSPESLVFKTGSLDFSELTNFIATYNRERYQFLFAGVAHLSRHEESLSGQFDPAVSFPNISNATSIEGMFHGASFESGTNLLLPNWTNISSASFFLYKATKDGDDGLVVTFQNYYGTGYQMFYTATAVTEIKVADGCTCKITNARQFVNVASSLTKISGIDFSEATNINTCFAYATSLAEIDCTGFKLSFDVTTTALEHDALVTLIASLDPVTTTQTLTMGSTKMALLSTEEIQVATGKGWVIA